MGNEEFGVRNGRLLNGEWGVRSAEWGVGDFGIWILPQLNNFWFDGADIVENFPVYKDRGRFLWLTQHNLQLQPQQQHQLYSGEHRRFA